MLLLTYPTLCAGPEQSDPFLKRQTLIQHSMFQKEILNGCSAWFGQSTGPLALP